MRDEYDVSTEVAQASKDANFNETLVTAVNDDKKPLKELEKIKSNKTITCSSSNKENEKRIEIIKSIEKSFKDLDELDERKDGPPLNYEEKAMIERWREQKKNNENPYCFNANSKTKNGSKIEKFELSQAGLFLATGSSDLNFGLLILGRCVQASSVGKNNEEATTFENLYNSIANALNALKPQDEIEGMLISRLVALHFQSIHYLGCAANNESGAEGRDRNINRSTKLSRLYNETLETLMRYRRKGEQKVVVQHVNVENGGKAIVGGQMISGGGDNNKK